MKAIAAEQRRLSPVLFSKPGDTEASRCRDEEKSLHFWVLNLQRLNSREVLRKFKGERRRVVEQ